MLIGAPPEASAGETRVALTSETTRRLEPCGRPIEVPSGAGADPCRSKRSMIDSVPRRFLN